MIDTIINLNDRAVAILRAGLYHDAITIWRTAIPIFSQSRNTVGTEISLQWVDDSFSTQLRQHGPFIMHSSPLTIVKKSTPDIVVTPSTQEIEKDKNNNETNALGTKTRIITTVLMYNLSLSIHCLALNHQSVNNDDRVGSLLSSALTLYKQARAFWVQLPQYLRMDVALLNNVGLIYHNLGRHDLSILCFQRMESLMPKLLKLQRREQQISQEEDNTIPTLMVDPIHEHSRPSKQQKSAPGTIEIVHEMALNILSLKSPCHASVA